MKVQVDGATIHVNREGKGPPALFLHGVPDSADLWNDVIDGCKGRYTCYAPDLPGIRRSDVPAGFGYDLRGYGGFVARLLDALEIHEPVHLVVHDWGGVFGLAFACEHPGRVARVLVSNTLFSPRYRWHAWARVWRTPLLGELSMVLMNPALFRAELRRGSCRLSDEHIRATWAGLRECWSSRFVVLKLYRSMSPQLFEPWQERLATLASRVPVQVVFGREDPYIPTEFAATFHSDDVTIVDDVGHWLPLEAPEFIIDAM